MKSRNFVLASAAIVFAIGGAVASALVPQDVYVKARLVQNGPIRCVNTGVQCETSGQNACIVSVPTTINGGTTTATTTGTFKTYLDSECSMVISNTITDVLTSPIQTYELIP